MPGLYNLGFQESDGIDLGQKLVEKSYLLDVYPGLAPWEKTPMLVGWGPNNFGQLGDNTITPKSSPVQTVAGGTNWKQVSQDGFGHTAAIKTDGTLWTWGRNFNGELGDNTQVYKSSPVQTVAGGTNWKQVATGYHFNISIKTDGTLWTWGRNDAGQIGDGTTTHRSSPIQTVAGGTNWKQVSAGKYHNTAIKTDGTLWLWGLWQMLADGTAVSKSSPVQTICSGTNWKQVSAGDVHTAAIKTDGTLWTWGINTLGSLGDNTQTTRNSPVQTICSGSNWKQVSAGYDFTSAIKTDGTLWSWGRNSYGQLGDNTTTHKASPVQTICSGSNWKQVSAGADYTMSIKTDGTLWGVGYNGYGRLGDGTNVNKSSPLQISTFKDWRQVSCFGSTFAIREA